MYRRRSVKCKIWGKSCPFHHNQYTGATAEAASEDLLGQHVCHSRDGSRRPRDSPGDSSRDEDKGLKPPARADGGGRDSLDLLVERGLAVVEELVPGEGLALSLRHEGELPGLDLLEGLEHDPAEHLLVAPFPRRRRPAARRPRGRGGREQQLGSDGGG